MAERYVYQTESRYWDCSYRCNDLILTCICTSHSSFRIPTDDTSSIENVLVEALTELASTAPTILGPFALTYIIFAATVTWPIIYFMQLNNFITSWFRLDYLNRFLKGG